MAMAQQAEWIKMTDAAREFGVSITKLRNMAAAGEISTKDDPRDKRVVLVDRTELRRIFGS